MSDSPSSVAIAPAPPPPPPQPAGAARASQVDQRVDILAGDRCCASCGFNLHGQTIVREQHYGLLMVRCPECGTPAAMQEYPTLARWTGRMRSLMAAAWIVVLLGSFAVTGAILYGLTDATVSAVTAPYTNAAGTEWTKWSEANLTKMQQSSWWANPQQIEAWWSSLPPDRFFADFGGWAKLNWFGLLNWVFLAAALVPIGIVYSVGLPRLRGWRMGVMLLIPIAFAGVLVAEDVIAGPSRWFVSHQTLVHRQVGWAPALMTLVVGGTCLFAGTLVGRPLARYFLSLALPPRLLCVFSDLWIVDGRELPRVR